MLQKKILMPSGPVKWLCLPAGFLCLTVGFLGILLPGLPATPFVLLAAWLFSLSSPRIERAIIDSRLFGPVIRNWRLHRGITRRTRWIALFVVAMTVGVTCFIAPVTDWLRWTVAFLAAIGIAVILRLRVLPD